MEKLINVYHVHDFIVNSNNKSILIGTSSAFDKLSKEEICSLIKKKVVLKRPGLEDILLNVTYVDVSSSLIDQKNIFILVDEHLSPNDIVDGSEIYYEQC